MAMEMGKKDKLAFAIDETDTLAGTSQEIVAPDNGFIDELQVIVQKAVTTGGAVTVNINGVAVAGLQVTVADAATKGTRYSDTPTAKDPTRAFLKGDRIEVVPAAAFATAGAISGYILFNTGM